MGDRTKIADAQIAAFKAAWHKADAEGRAGERVRDGLAAAGVLRADPDTSNELFTEARRLLDAATTAPRSHRCPDGMVDDVISWACQHCGEWQRDYGPQTDCAAAPEPTMVHAPSRLIAALLERAVTAEADRDEAERRERTAVNLANYHRGVAREAGRRADAARPPAPTESTPDPPYQPVAGRPTMDLLDRGTDR